MGTTRRSSLHGDSATGFTLIEVLVAVAILGIALTSLSVGTGNSVRAFSASRDATTASLLAETRITELRIANALPATGSLQKEQFKGYFSNYTSELTVTDTPFADIKEVRVNIGRNESNDKIDELLTYVTPLVVIVEPPQKSAFSTKP